MDYNPVANIRKDTFDTLKTAITSSSGMLSTGTSGVPWGHSPNIFKAAMAMRPNSNTPTSGAVDFDSDTNFGDWDQSAFCIFLINGLDGALRQSDYYRDSGDMTSAPYYDAVVHPKGGVGTAHTYDKAIPGKQVIMRNRRYGLTKSKQKPDVETYGSGLWLFNRRGGFYGVGCAIALTSDDPDFPYTMAIAGDVSFGGAGGMGLCMDLHGTHQTLNSLYDNTADTDNTPMKLTHSATTKRGSKTATVTATAHMTNMLQFNENLASGLQQSQLWTIAVCVTKTVT